MRFSISCRHTHNFDSHFILRAFNSFLFSFSICFIIYLVSQHLLPLFQQIYVTHAAVYLFICRNVCSISKHAWFCIFFCFFSVASGNKVRRKLLRFVFLKMNNCTCMQIAYLNEQMKYQRRDPTITHPIIGFVESTLSFIFHHHHRCLLFLLVAVEGGAAEWSTLSPWIIARLRLAKCEIYAA